jgi:uncharacterized membrane protein YidH (DUF202 family)
MKRMAMDEEEKKAEVPHNRRVHLANERTFLAWIRTSIALMAFGFVVEKFALFVKEAEYLLMRAVPGVSSSMPKRLPGPGYSSIFGIVLVAIGSSVGLMSYIRYKKIEREIDDNTYRPSALLMLMTALSLFAVGIFLLVYLIHSL